MAARKTMNVPEAQRHTVARKLRLSPEVAEMLDASAEAEELTLSEYVTRLEQERRLSPRIAQAEADLDADEQRRSDRKLSASSTRPR